MRDRYLEEVLGRAAELRALEAAAMRLPDRTRAVRWAVAAALGLLAALVPSAGAAQALLYLI